MSRAAVVGRDEQGWRASPRPNNRTRTGTTWCEAQAQRSREAEQPGSVEESTMHGNALATVKASSSRSVQFPAVESLAGDGDHRRSGRRNTRMSPCRERRSSVRHRREHTNHAQHVPPPQRHQCSPRAESRGPPSAGGRSSYRQEAGSGRD